MVGSNLIGYSRSWLVSFDLNHSSKKKKKLSLPVWDIPSLSAIVRQFVFLSNHGDP